MLRHNILPRAGDTLPGLPDGEDNPAEEVFFIFYGTGC